ncbi:MAG: transcriptional regulator [Thermoproteota archaeon]|nr:MAG: transcriptional regulator [Candidatus Korarchaeota archaeon]
MLCKSFLIMKLSKHDSNCWEIKMQRRRGIGDKEIKVLRMLVEDGRITYTGIAKKLGMSPAGVMKKVRKLEEFGIIKGYTAIVDHAKLRKPYKYIIMVKTEPGKHLEVAKSIQENLKESVLEVHTITGPYDVIMKLLAGNSEELNELLKKLHSIDGVRETNTSLILETIEERPSVVPEDVKLPILTKESKEE